MHYNGQKLKTIFDCECQNRHVFVNIQNLMIRFVNFFFFWFLDIMLLGRI